MSQPVVHSPTPTLPTHPFFLSSPETWQAAASGFLHHVAEKGQVVVRHGDPAHHIWLVQSGWVKLIRQTPDGLETIIGLCTAGDFFGEAGFFPHANYPYYAEALTPCELIAVPAAVALSVMENNARISRYVMRLLNERLGQAQLQLEQLNTMSASQRLGCFLLKLCRDQSEGSLRLHIPVEKNVLATFLGMKPETLSRSLKSLHACGISHSGNTIAIQNISQLRAFVCNSCSEAGSCE